MPELTSRERMDRILHRQPVDRIGLYEAFWNDTHRKWSSEGHVGENESLQDHFNFDLRMAWPFNFVADLDFGTEVIEETEETILTRNGNGAVFRSHKLHASTPEHVDFRVKDRDGWLEHIRARLLNAADYERRINFQAYRDGKADAAAKNRYFCWSGVNVFELMHPICGHENMLMGMALDPDWVKDMCNTLAGVTIDLMEILFEREGLPDGAWFYEDMGFKQRPFMSPDMYRRIIKPAHARTFAYAHSLGLPVIVHSCGFIEPLLPDLVDAGLDCLQVMEVKAGMDPLRIKQNFGDRIVLFGGMDARNLVANDRDAIRQELAAKIPALKQDYGYILHSDHSIPTTTEYETYRFFVDEGLRLGTY